MKFSFNIRYHSGESNFTSLDFYYGADSLGGFAEVLALTTHAIVKNQVVKQTPATKGFDLSFKEAHRGSYIQKVELEFTDPDAIKVINFIGVDGFMEILNFHIKSPLGTSSEIRGSMAQRWFRSHMDGSEALLKRLSRPLERIHHPVLGQGYQVTLYKSRTPIASFNDSTLDYLTGGETSQATEFLELAVSRFNARTGTGRFIVDEESDSISFTPLKAGVGRNAKIALASSLKDLAEGKVTKLPVEIRRVTARDGRTKHMILQAVHL